MFRAIHIFPQFSNQHFIDDIRLKYDPLANLIVPHITLVFPFESDISIEALAEHLRKSTANFKPFRIVMTGITGAEGEYLFLNVKSGNDQVIELHDKLYTGLLKQYLFRAMTYTPHLTVGRIKDKQKFELALRETEDCNHVFESMVHEIVVESVDAREHSVVETKVPLTP